MGTRSRKKGSFDRSESFKTQYYQNNTTNPKFHGDSDDIIVPSVSVPFGEEEGGLSNIFKKMVGKSNSTNVSTDVDSDLSYSDDSSLAATTVPDGDFAAIHRQFLDSSQTIEEKEHSGRFHTNRDSKFKKIKTTVASLNAALSGTANISVRKKYLNDIDKIIIKYQNALTALKDYLEFYGANDAKRTPEIESRLNLVRPFYALFEKDMAAFSAVSRDALNNESASLESYNDILFKARVIDLSNTTDHLETEGAGTSVLIKRTKSDGSVDYIKPEERSLSSFNNEFDINQATDKDYEQMGKSADEMISMFKSQSSASEALYAEFLAFFETNPIKKKDGTSFAPDLSFKRLLFNILVKSDFVNPIGKPEKKKDQSEDNYKQESYTYAVAVIKNSTVYREFDYFKPFFDHFTADADKTFKLCDFLTLTAKKRTESDTSSNSAKIEKGSTISDRNVSTSIMAEGLGTEDIVARSQTILMKDHHGNIIRANSMEKAEGVEIGKLRAEAEQAEKDDAEQKAALGSSEPPLKVVVTLTPNALVQLSDLHVFDMICGQVDRKDSNYIVQYQKMPADENNKAVWYVTSVKAIDNDMAFGNLTLQDVKERGTGELAEFFTTEKAQDATLADQNLFCISKKLFDRIMIYTPDMAAVSQRHLRTDSEIKALQGRLEGVKSKLKEMLSAGKLVLVENDEQAQAVYQTAREALADKSEANKTGYIIKAVLQAEGLNYNPSDLSKQVTEEVSDESQVIAEDNAVSLIDDKTTDAESSTIETDEEGFYVNPLYEEGEAIEAQATDISNDTAGYDVVHRSFLDFSKEVIEDKRKAVIGHHSNDGAYREVQNSIRKLLDILSAPVMNSNKEMFLHGLRSVVSSYDSALATLKIYVDNKKGAITPSGRARLRMVREYISLLEADRKGFMAASQSMYGKDSIEASSYNEILYNARLIDLTDKKERIEIVGGGTSVVNKRFTEAGIEFVKVEEKGLAADPDSDTGSISSAKEIFDMFRRQNTAGDSLYDGLYSFFETNPLEKSKGIMKKGDEAVYEFIASFVKTRSLHDLVPPKKQKNQSDDEYKSVLFSFYKGCISSCESYTDDPYVRKACKYISSDYDMTINFINLMGLVRKKVTEYDVLNDAQVKAGSTVSDRNVSSSILAKRLNAGNLIADSETVMMRDRDGSLVRANSMNEAKGKSLLEIEKEAQKMEKADAKRRAKTGDSGPELKISVVYTPQCVVQLSDLMVLDMLSGQIDRNLHNRICQYEKGEPDESGHAIWYVTSVMGIDNDMSFGNLTMEDLHEKNNTQMRWLSAFFRSKEEAVARFNFANAPATQNLFCISENLYNSIMSYSPDMAAFDQRHLRSDEEIEALKTRLKEVKAKLEEMKDMGLLVIVSSDEQAREVYSYMQSRSDVNGSKRKQFGYIEADYLSDAGKSFA